MDSFWSTGSVVWPNAGEVMPGRGWSADRGWCRGRERAEEFRTGRVGHNHDAIDVSGRRLESCQISRQI